MKTIYKVSLLGLVIILGLIIIGVIIYIINLLYVTESMIPAGPGLFNKYSSMTSWNY